MNKIITDYQFVISKDPKNFSAGFSFYDFAGYSLSYDSRYSIIEIRAKDSTLCSVIIGFIHFANNLYFIGHGSNEEISKVKIESIDDIERELLPKLSGSFILLTFGILPNRLYMDHGGSIPVIYDRETGNISTTPIMFLDEASYKKRFRTSLYEELIVQEHSGGWISGTLTAHKSIYRLLPNFFLDLDKLEQHRYWPRNFNMLAWIDTDTAIHNINSNLRIFTTAATNSFRVFHTLTAGYDSRLLLSACRDVTEKCGFFTIDVPGAFTDKFMAKKIAEQFKLDHIVLELIKSNDVDSQLWDTMVGHCVNETNRETFRTLAALKNADFIFTGMYGEIGRCRLYRQDYKNVNNLPINPEIIMSRLTIPRNKLMAENIEKWLASLSGSCNSVIFDLAFLELKFGSWAMGQHPIQNSLKFGLLPFAQRPILEAFLRIQPEEKTTHVLFDKCIKSAWPELSNFPINSAGTLKDFQYKMLKLTSATRIKRYLRDRFARLW